MDFKPSIRISRVRIRNFRCLRAVTVSLDAQTLLIGENNSGKTSFARAIYAAVGAGQRGIDEADVFLKPTESKPPRSRAVTIDLLVQPVNDDGEIAEEFDPAGPWFPHFGNAVILDTDDNQVVCLRTECRWNHELGEYEVTRNFLKRWPRDADDADTLESVVGEKLGRRHILPFELSYLDADRDIAGEIRSRTSNWRRLVADLGLSDDTTSALEKSLREVNDRVIAESEVLAHLESHLNRLFDTIASDSSSVTIAPVQTHLRDVVRGVDALVATRGGPAFPLASQGMGTRSLSSLLTFQALMDWKAKQSSASALHPFLAIEEPEAHLQPQAQRALAAQLLGLRGQVIITTHSPYVCSSAGIETYRVFYKSGGESSVREFSDFARLSEKEQRNLRRQVLNTRGDVLFSRCIVFFEGETEEQCMPALIEDSLGAHPGTLGLSLVGVGGAGNFPVFVRLAKTFGIPWHVFADGEDQVLKNLDKGLKKIGEEPCSTNPRVHALPGGADFEGYICTECSASLIREMIVDSKASGPEDRVRLTEEWRKREGEPEALAQELRSSKTAYGSRIAASILAGPLPDALAGLFRAVRSDLGIAEE